MKLIGDELVASLQEQLGAEKYNANLYLYIAGFLRNKGLNNLANHFIGQHGEETEHAKIIFDLLTDLNAPVRIPEISEVNLPINSVLDVANLYLSRELATTESLNEIKKQAIDNDNPVVEERLREMIKMQQNEYEEACDWSDKAELVGNDWKFVLLWDLGLG